MGESRALGDFSIDTSDLDRFRTPAHDQVELGVGAGGDAVGWEARDEITRDSVPTTLTAQGTAYRGRTHDETQAINVDGDITLEDTHGQCLELFHGAELDDYEFCTEYRTEFVTDELGLGHLVVTISDFAAAIGLAGSLLEPVVESV